MPRKKKADPTPMTQRERDRRYHNGRKRAGFKRVRVYVPAKGARVIRALARQLRQEWTAAKKKKKKPVLG